MIDISISASDVLVGTQPNDPLCGLQRVVEVIPKLDRVVLIPIPVPKRSSHANQWNYYAKGFHTKELSQLHAAIASVDTLVQHKARVAAAYDPNRNAAGIHGTGEDTQSYSH